jgi:hypothetical protein
MGDGVVHKKTLNVVAWMQSAGGIKDTPSYIKTGTQMVRLLD